MSLLNFCLVEISHLIFFAFFGIGMSNQKKCGREDLFKNKMVENVSEKNCLVEISLLTFLPRFFFKMVGMSLQKKLL